MDHSDSLTAVCCSQVLNDCSGRLMDDRVIGQCSSPTCRIARSIERRRPRKPVVIINPDILPLHLGWPAVDSSNRCSVLRPSCSSHECFMAQREFRTAMKSRSDPPSFLSSFLTRFAMCFVLRTRRDPQTLFSTECRSYLIVLQPGNVPSSGLYYFSWNDLIRMFTSCCSYPPSPVRASHGLCLRLSTKHPGRRPAISVGCPEMVNQFNWP
jgi:hypothetical protein